MTGQGVLQAPAADAQSALGAHDEVVPTRMSGRVLVERGVAAPPA